MIKWSPIGAASALIALSLAAPSQAQTSLLQYPSAGACSVADLGDWFEGHTVTAGGLVTPADSASFADTSDCNFYKWSARMFLWLTSPLGNNRLVLDSPALFDVSAKAESGPEKGTRHFIRNDGTDDNTFALRDLKPIDEPIEEIGQAGSGGVLMSQGQSLVYYGVHTNDVFAQFLTANKTHELNPPATRFPTSTGWDAGITPPPPLLNPDTLAMELKTAWIIVPEAQQADFVTIDATVPAYAKCDQATSGGFEQWVQSETRNVTLALVGMHVVGSVKGHPEMIWATVEHKRNAPNNEYWISFDTPFRTIDVPVPYNPSGDWLFFSKDDVHTPRSQLNRQLMKAGSVTCTTGGRSYTDSPGILATTASGMAPSSTYRVNPWGDAPTSASAANNNKIIALNQSVIRQLATGDVRANYLMHGAIWTDGTIPTAPGAPTIGSTRLANTTMETYTQSDNCFDCHFGKSGSGLDGLSHIYKALLPLGGN